MSHKKNVIFWRVLFYFLMVSRHCLIHHFDKKEPIQKQTRQNQTLIGVTAYFITRMSTSRLSDTVIVNTIEIRTIYVTPATNSILRSTTSTLSTVIFLSSTVTISDKSKIVIVEFPKACFYLQNSKHKNYNFVVNLLSVFHKLN